MDKEYPSLRYLNRAIMLVAAFLILLAGRFVGGLSGYHTGLAWVAFFLLGFPALVWLAWCAGSRNFKKRVVANAVIAPFSLYVLVTGGIDVEYRGGFQRTYTGEIFNIDGMRSRMEIVEPDALIEIPLICLLYYPKSPPHAVRLDVTDDTGRLRSITIETAVVDYGEGNRSNHRLDWSQDVKFYTVTQQNENGVEVEMRITQLTGELPPIIQHNRAFTIELEGFFVTSGDHKTSFRTNPKELEYEEPQLHVSTLWYGLSQI